MKSKVTAVLLSGLVFPGSGQWYLGRRKRALAFAAGAFVGALAYGNQVMEDASAVVDQALNGSVALDPAALSAQLAARPTPWWVTAAVVLLIACWAGSIAEAALVKTKAA